MGKTTSVSSTSATACCRNVVSSTGTITKQTSGIIGVTCTSAGEVTKIDWSMGFFVAEIPSEIGKLVSLKELYLRGNLLSGSVPSEIRNLAVLKKLDLSFNPLSGNLTPRCNTSVEVFATSITICGCTAASTAPTLFPPPGTPDACLSSGPALSLSKRILAFSQVIGSFKYTCNTDANNNPFADCLNSMAKFCNTADPTFDKNRCQTGVDTMFRGMNSWWQNVRKECGQWSSDGSPASSTPASSFSCVSANLALTTNAYYISWNPQKGLYENIQVTSELTYSINERLWSKIRA